MRLNVKAFIVTSGVFWALTFLMVTITNLVWSGYGTAFLQVVASIYPGYHGESCVRDIVAGTLYALVDGAVAGLIFACIYNLVASNKESPA
jgi:hypothetical protein